MLRTEILGAAQDLRKSLKAERDAAEAARAQAKEAEATLRQHQSAATEAADLVMARVRPYSCSADTSMAILALVAAAWRRPRLQCCLDKADVLHSCTGVLCGQQHRLT